MVLFHSHPSFSALTLYKPVIIHHHHDVTARFFSVTGKLLKLNFMLGLALCIADGMTVYKKVNIREKLDLELFVSVSNVFQKFL